jgi:hypothetical protein
MTWDAERSLIMHASIRAFILVLTAVAVLGCAHQPVPLELAVDHPANPQAAEMKFVPPPDPFRNYAETNSVAQAEAPSMIHEHAQQASKPLMEQPMGQPMGHHIGHQMGHGATVEPAPDGLTHPHQMSPGHQHEDNP